MSTVSESLAGLPSPPPENLTSYFILSEIIDHIDSLKDEFPHVRIHLLKKILWHIRNTDVNHETHLRGFLRVFEGTDVYREAFNQLDDGMKRQLMVFSEGGTHDQILRAGTQQDGGFTLPPSPPVKHHFQSLAKKIDTFFHKDEQTNEDSKSLPKPVEKVDNVVGLAEDKQTDGSSDSSSQESSSPDRRLNGLSNFLAKNTVKIETHFHREKQTRRSSNDTNGGVDTPAKPLSQVTSHAGLPKIYEDAAKTQPMEVHADRPFNNWALSVSNTPLYTFVPKTVLGLQNLVKWAKMKGYRIRCSGYRHSWAEVFSQDKQILVSLLNIEAVTKLPDTMSVKGECIDPSNELKTITLAAPPGVTTSSAENALVRVGVSVTSEQFRRWAVSNNKWTLPVDVILVEVTFGGASGPICHGAGRAHQTINDYIRAIEYIDANGIHRTISDPAHLLAAAGHFGLLGIVTHVTFELSPMSYAIMKPIKPDIGLAIPPSKREDIPIAIRKTFTQSQYDAALADFESRAENDYYAEWFWFTRNQQAWVNTWNPVSDSEGVVEYPSPMNAWFQWVEGWLGAVITDNPIFQAMPGRWQAELLATFGMVALPPFEFDDRDFGQERVDEIKTALPNALHFRRGIQNMRVRSMEFQIPIPSLATDPSRPDFTIVRRAWWDIINLCYESDSCPMRLALELRIMGDSKLLMAPQYGNKHGTASIEVVSIPDAVSDGEWGGFLQRVSDLWMGYEDAEGRKLNVRPHWAKEWQGLNMRGKPALEYLKTEAYKDQIPKFKATLADIGKLQGCGLEDIQKRFSNEMWDYLIYD